jgi:CDGSH-type Zn-finger protein
MSEPKPTVAARQPALVTLEPGTYWWCRCGLSKNQPFCDGAHAATSFVPLQFEVKQAKQLALCQCKQTKNPPFCDGTHTKL